MKWPRSSIAALSLGFVLAGTQSPRAGAAVSSPSAQADAVAPRAGEKVTALLAEAEALRLALEFDKAHARVDAAIAEAERTSDRSGLAAAHRLKGILFNSQGQGKEESSWLERALQEYESLGDRRGVASALMGMTTGAIRRGDRMAAKESATRALAILTELGDDSARGTVLLHLVDATDSHDADDPRLREVLAIADRLGDDSLRAHALRLRGGMQFLQGELSNAQGTLAAAVAAYERAREVDGLAAATLMLGRVRRAHGDYEGALQQYERAIALLAPTQERYTIVEATNAKAVALGYLNRPAEALAAYERGLSLARESANPQLIDFMLGNLGGGLMGMNDYARAIPVLEEVLSRKPSPYIAAFRNSQLAIAMAYTGRDAEALERANEALRLTRESNQVDYLDSRLDDRAWILSRLGRLDDALRDARESLAVIDQVRAKLIPLDFLKRGYADRVQGAYARNVDLLVRLGRGTEALEFAEQGRARAFLDLLAAREQGQVELDTRGAATASAAAPPALDLRSQAIAAPLAADGINRVAARLGATLLTYWVADDATVAWVVTPDGRARYARVVVPRARLTELVAATTAPLRQAGSARPAAPSVAAANPPAAAGDGDITKLPLRGLGLLALRQDDRAAWRELYRLLIEPVRTSLPARGGRVTVIPHGPLFQLSFAALQNGAGRYLIEDYDLHYAPAVSLLEFTGRRQQEVRAGSIGPWALVGNPASLPVVGDRPLAPLPGAAREIAAIAAIAPAGRLVRLDRSRAGETDLARMLQADRPSVLHFATHGFVFDDPKTPPFLALNRSGADGATDGRLTMDEVYGLRLGSDLVVLSACRTGTGRVSSDGILGLTRAFFYAGTASVMATFWDVTDETTAIFMPRFYRGYAKDRQKASSLRAAQLALLADLRAGRAVVTAAGRRVTLPEHPLLWAGFFLSGEP